jgi:hypothetical protein
MPEEENNPEPKINTKKIDNWFTAMLSRKLRTENPEEIREYVRKKKVVVRLVPSWRWQLVTITDGKNRVLGQLPVRLFISEA